ncbi:universal stress protein [Spongiactinospora sp. TRM90649]|uniref:universal stress protein n=1 Tax=Spongiactinospora sp. TRM90649 TaxID=3031114 RepID=UPI0023F818A1|nr:universal stress protein [Spongiactinospora sp. TRM90649]MDF5757227.1 universal stress protein [Spongiactinospora sp. TRM90649]
MRTSQPRIVVGFSRSAASAAALLWALHEAREHGTAVVAVHAWQWSGESRASYAPMDTWRCRDDELRAVRQSAERAIADLVPDPAARLAVTTVVEQGPAVQVLLRHAEGAELLVLGSRPYDPDLPAPMGPVLAACLPRASCPVVVVTPEMARPALTPAFAGTRPPAA